MCVYNETKKVGVEKEEKKKKENPWCSCGLFLMISRVWCHKKNDKYGKFFQKVINYKLMNNKNKNPLRNITIEKYDYWKI